MNIEEKLIRIKRGNTAPGVNRAVIEYLLGSSDIDEVKMLDVPCGNCDLLDAVKNIFPDAATFGADIAPPPANNTHHLLAADLSRPGQLDLDTKFSLITSISGVMEFDNTLNFFEQLREQITDDGTLIVSNDNLLSIRDRILYLFAGRFRQFPMFVADDAPTWKILPLQNLLRILIDAGFEPNEIRYVRPKPAEWLWLPIAIPIYLSQLASFALSKTSLTYKEKAARCPFASLFSRHYFVICRTKNGRTVAAIPR